MGGPTSVGSISRYLEDPISRSLRMRSIDRSRPNPSLNVNYRALFLFIDCYAVVSFISLLLFEILRRRNGGITNNELNLIDYIVRYYFKFSNFVRY